MAVLMQMPGLPALYARALLQGLLSAVVPPGRRRPTADVLSTGESIEGVRLSADRLTRYRTVCGFGPDVDVPATYLHVAAFPLQLRLMTAPPFPFPALGLVHVENTIVQERRVSSSDVLDLSVFATDLRPHRRGRQVTVVTQARVAGEVAWSEDSVFLSRSASAVGTSKPRQEAVETSDRSGAAGTQVIAPRLWQVPAQAGRRYAAVSGDRNPIHLFDVTARPFGLSHHIAHGMWSKARALAELTDRLPDRFQVHVVFRSPLTLPAAVQFSGRDDGSHIVFDVTSAAPDPQTRSGGSTTSGTQHLVGVLTRL